MFQLDYVSETYNSGHSYITDIEYRIRPNRRPGRLGKFVLYHYSAKKIVKWAIISENKVKSREEDR